MPQRPRRPAPNASKRVKPKDQLQALREALKLSDLRDALESTESTDDLLERLLACAVRTLGTEEGSITQLDVAKGELYFRAAHSLSKAELMQLRLPITEGVLGYVARSGQPLCVQDVSQDERFDSTVDETVGFTTDSIVAAPILSSGKVIGVIELINLLGDEEVTQEDLAVLGMFADVASVILNQERQRKGTLAFLQRALKSDKLPTDSREIVAEALKGLGEYKRDPGYKRSLKIAGLVRNISQYDESAAEFVEHMLNGYLEFLGGGRR